MRKAFDSRIYFEEVTDNDIGKLACGKNHDWIAYILQEGSSAWNLVGVKTLPPSKSHKHTDLFLKGFQVLFRTPEIRCATLVVHWFEGLVSDEVVNISVEETLTLQQFSDRIYTLEEDGKYTIVESEDPTILQPWLRESWAEQYLESLQIE